MQRLRVGPWALRDGRGAGNRVSCASAEAEWTKADIAIAEQGMGALGQPNLFMIRAQDAALDAHLADLSYRVVDPVVAYHAPVAAIARFAPEPLKTFAHWPPLAIACDVWAQGHIGPARLGVMDRVQGPHAAILARQNDRAAGAAFVARSGDWGIVHAVLTLPAFHRQGSAQNMLGAAALWAQEAGAVNFGLVVTKGNKAARGLYQKLGMTEIGEYHYRQRDDRT